MRLPWISSVCKLELPSAVARRITHESAMSLVLARLELLLC